MKQPGMVLKAQMMLVKNFDFMNQLGAYDEIDVDLVPKGKIKHSNRAKANIHSDYKEFVE
jgi:hypothetical protein